MELVVVFSLLFFIIISHRILSFIWIRGNEFKLRWAVKPEPKLVLFSHHDRCSKLCRVNTALLTKGSARPCSVGEWEVAWVKVQDSGNMLGLWAVWLLANECIGYFAKPTCVSYKLLCSFYAEDRLQTSSPTLPFPLSFSCFLPYCFLCSFVLSLCMPEHCDQCNTR